MLGIVQDLVDIFRICSFQEDNLRPPLFEECGDLDELVHVLGIGRRVNIVYQFLSNDGITPSACTIRIDSKDPRTGKPIADMDFFLREYYKEEDKQVHKNIEAIRRPFTEKEKAWLKNAAIAYIRIFKEENGYRPSVDSVRYHLEQISEENYHLYLDQIKTQNGEPVDEFADEFMQTDEDPFGTDLPDDIYALREIASSLTGRLRAVYEAMLQHAAGGAGRTTFKEVADEWHVSYNQVMEDSKRMAHH